MRNNLIFTNIPEHNSRANESKEITEKKLRYNFHEALKIAKDVADNIKFERAHGSPGHTVHGKVRTVVATYTFFKDREIVRRQWKT